MLWSGPPAGQTAIRGGIVAILTAAAAFLSVPSPRRLIHLPPGIVDVHAELIIQTGTEVAGSPLGTVLHAAPDFIGRAVIVVQGNGVRLRGFTVDGNRKAIETRSGLPASDVPFTRFTHGNGILAEGVDSLFVERVQFRNIAGFAILASRSRNVTIDRVEVTDSGSRTPQGRNNSTGGILLEEGAIDFRVTRSEFRNIRGNGVWTHSLYTSPRSARGLFAWNRFDTIGRDALQVGHATDVRVEQNSGRRIGFPIEDVDIENRAVPVAIDTAGNVERCSYTGNHFAEIDGKCIDLDGFHDGEIRGNVCINRGAPGEYRFGNYGIVMNNSNPDMQSQNILIVDNLIDGPLFGGIFVIGTGHSIARNRLLNLNTSHCNEEAARFGCYYSPGEPDMLQSGIYLGRGADRPAPATGNTIEDNEITGFRMNTRCIARAPGVRAGWNVLRDNRCYAK